MSYSKVIHIPIAKRMKVYIATGLENTAKYAEVREALARIKVGITYDWTAHGAVWSMGLKIIRNVAVNELNGVKKADIVIVILPGGRGTHAELGMALALGKLVFILAEGEKEKQMNGAVPETCAFYHHPLVHWVESVEQLYGLVCSQMSIPGKS